MEQSKTTVAVEPKAAAALLAYGKQQKAKEGTAKHVTYSRVIEAGLKALKGAK